MINCITAKDAKIKLCCGAEDCGNMIEDGSRVCAGPACMAWRWQTAIFDVKKGQWLQQGDIFQPGEIETRVTDLGYCGLAGVPSP